MKEITVELGERSYPVKIGQGILRLPDVFKPYIPGHKVCIVTNDTVAKLYLKQVRAQLEGYEINSVIINDGEVYKNLDTYRDILDHMLTQGVDRKSTVIALGGGVVGDVAGFAAASCLRGINLIQAPTTLLAQVDSSVGGKTGVNHEVGKNLIGAFYQPSCVIADLDTLKSLPKREFSAGMAEVIKYGFIRDAEFIGWLEANTEAVLNQESMQMAHIIARSCEIKADVVAADEHELGIRAILNLGHTFGHAIEAATGYTEWLHGEAISAGMVMAARLSAAMGMISQQDVARVSRLLVRYGLPVDASGAITRSRMKELMMFDKKTKDARLHLVLLKQLGQAWVTPEFPSQLLDETIAMSLPA